MSTDKLIKEGDHVVINGGGVHKIAEIKPKATIRLGKAGSASALSLVGLPYGCVVELNHKERKFVLTDAYPDLDLSSTVSAGERDNRCLCPNSESQQLSNTQVEEIRKEKGVNELLDRLVENSATFQTKTNFAQEKYIRKKKKLYGVLYKVEAVMPDNLAEIYVPTINPVDESAMESKCTRLRCDTLALILHHANVHARSRVLTYNKTNGVLEACLLDRLGESGELFQLLDRNAQPNTFTAVKVMKLDNVKKRWHAIPGNDDFLRGEKLSSLDNNDNYDCKTSHQNNHTHICGSDSNALEEDKSNNVIHTSVVSIVNNNISVNKENNDDNNNRKDGALTNNEDTASTSLWMTGANARELLLQRPVDSLIVVDCENDDGSFATASRLVDLLQFVSTGGHVVVYSAFLQVLTELFDLLRDECVSICISDTWYRHYQVLPQRTHPSVNMNTAGGYLLTAIKVEPYSSVRKVCDDEKALNKTTNNIAQNNAHTANTHKRTRDSAEVDNKM